MIVAGLIPSVIAKLFWPADHLGRLFILGITGSFLAGAIQYSEHQPISFVLPSIGAVIMLGLYAVVRPRSVVVEEQLVEEEEHDDFRKAA
jgi:uncharacterized membrane protein YeaQ/YmgE (transglycosylase-associated protein family)